MGLFKMRPLITVTETKPKPKAKPAKKVKEPPEPMIVHKPWTLGDCLTVKETMKWEREHLAAYEAELRNAKKRGR